jgi:hypothetical protein
VNCHRRAAHGHTADGKPCLNSNVTEPLRQSRCIVGVAGSHPANGRAPTPCVSEPVPSHCRPRRHLSNAVLFRSINCQTAPRRSGHTEPSGDTHSSSALAISQARGRRSASHLHGHFRSGSVLDKAKSRRSGARSSPVSGQDSRSQQPSLRSAHCIQLHRFLIVINQRDHRRPRHGRGDS